MNFELIHQAVREVMEYLNCNPVSAALLTRSLDGESYLAEHAGNVFYLSMLVGSVVQDYIAQERQRQSIARELKREHVVDLTPLGLGAMMADLGMLPHYHLYSKTEPLTDAELDAVRRHPQTGADMLPEEFSALGRMVVRTHHENFDGSGYPAKLMGNKLHIFTRIVRIADAYDAATATHMYKEAKSPARVLWEMTSGPYQRFYDPRLMKVFLTLIQPFPIGAKIRLTDGRHGVVTRYNRQDPFQPELIIAFDAHGQRLSNDKLEGPLLLDQNSKLRMDSFAGEDLSFVYKRAVSQPAMVSSHFGNMHEAAYP